MFLTTKLYDGILRTCSQSIKFGPVFTYSANHIILFQALSLRTQPGNSYNGIEGIGEKKDEQEEMDIYVSQDEVSGATDTSLTVENVVG